MEGNNFRSDGLGLFWKEYFLSWEGKKYDYWQSDLLLLEYGFNAKRNCETQLEYSDFTVMTSCRIYSSLNVSSPEISLQKSKQKTGLGH